MTRRNTTKSVKEIFAEEEISLLDLLRLFTDRKKYIFICAGFFFVIGILIAVTSPVEYESESQVLSEESDGGHASGLGGLSGLAGLAGIQLPQGGQGGGAGLSPDMYPTIANSEPFLLDLMEERFYFQELDMEMSLYEYFSQERPGHIFSKTFGFLRGIPGRLFSLLEKKKEWAIPAEDSKDGADLDDHTSAAIVQRIMNITPTQKYVLTQLGPRISIESNGRIITVKLKMPEPYISAELNNIVLAKVIRYVTAYKTEKQRENLAFIQERANEAEANFKEAQLRLATFRDANQGMVTQTARTKEEQLQAEFNLTVNLYNSLAQQLEQTKIQLKKDTPLFTEFVPVSVPLNKSEPNIPKIIFLYLALGIVFGGMAIFVSIIVAYFKESKPIQEDVYID